MDLPSAKGITQSEINEGNIDAVIQEVLQGLDKFPKSKQTSFINVDLFGEYVSKFLNSNRRKSMNSHFAKEVMVIPTQPLLDAIESSLCK